VELRPKRVGEAPPAREEAAAEAAGPDRAGLRDDEPAAERGRPEEAAAPEGEPSMLERAKRRLEGLVSGAGPADREAADADRPDERPGVDRDRR
jgi:hypothetical protein